MPTKKKKKSRSFRYFSKPEGPAKPNPFDLKVNHKKYSYVGGRGVKGESGRPTESRSRAIEKRKTRLEKHLRSHERSNRFKDKRVGERETDLTDEQKSLMRLQAFKSAVNTEADCQPDCPLTINQQSLVLSDEDGEGDEVMEALWSDGNENQNDKFREAIARAKLAKAERVKEKSEVDETTIKMNTDWETMKPILRFRSDAANLRQSQPDEYDSFVQSLKFSRRSQNVNTDRTMNFESKQEYINRMEKEIANRMEPPNFEPRKYVSPDDLDDDIEETNKIQQFNDSRPMFLTELSHVSSDDIAIAVPQTFDAFMKDVSDSSLSSMLSSSNPLRTGGDKTELSILALHTWNALRVASSNNASLLPALARTFQTIVYHYPEECEQFLVDFLEHSFESGSVQYRNTVLRLVGLVYSVSDYRHRIGSVALCRGAELLRSYDCISMEQCRDAMTTCLIVSDYVKGPRRLVPELLHCLLRLIRYLSNGELGGCTNSVACTDPSTSCADCLLRSSLQCLRMHLEIMARLPCKRLLSTRIIDCIEKVNGHSSVRDQIRDEVAQFNDNVIVSSSMPDMIAMKTPRMKARYTKMSLENNLKKKIEVRRRYKKELRCTAREIKREGQVLSGLKLKRQKMLDEQRMEKVKRIMSDLANQEGEYRKMKKAR